MDTIEKNVNDWFQTSTFGHQEELGFKKESFTESEMILFGQICAEKQKAIDDKRIAELEAEVDQAIENRDYWKEQAIALKAKEKELIDKACEWLRNNLGYYDRHEVHIGKSYEEVVIDDFRKSMEE